MGELSPEQAAPRLSAPVPVSPDHDLSGFDCGEPTLDTWLKTRALKAEGLSARTYVTAQGARVVGYYCFATGAVSREDAPSKIRRNMPEDIPVILLGRLAVDHRFQGEKIGQFLLRDALQRALAAAEIVGARAILVHAIDPDAASYYAQFGFLPSSEGGQTLFLPLETIRRAL